jgi:uncharacterized protein Veg
LNLEGNQISDEQIDKLIERYPNVHIVGYSSDSDSDSGVW